MHSMVKMRNSHTLNPVLRSFWETKADIRVLKGGRDSTKTWDAGGFATFLSSNYNTKFLCIRQFQNKIAESVYAVLKIQIDRFGLWNEYDIQKTTITHKITGSSFHFYGIQRNIDEIKGFEGADICWIEEAEGLTKSQMGIIEPTIRKEGSEIWLVYNPRLETDFVETYKHDLKGSVRVIVRHINYDENQFLSNISLRRINALKESDYDEYAFRYLGVPKASDDEAVIKRSWIMAAIDAHVKLKMPIAGSKDIGFDVADSGADLCAQVYKHGIVALWGEKWKAKEDELLKSCTRVYRKAVDLGAEIVYDSIGVGAHCGAKIKELNEDNKTKVKHSKFNAADSCVNPDKYYINDGTTKTKNKDFFCNLKAQSWWTVADRFRNTYNAVVRGEKFEAEDLISISSDMPEMALLVTELSTPKRDFAKDGRVKVESKDDLKKRDIDSPNVAEAFIAAYAPKTLKGTFMIS